MRLTYNGLQREVFGSIRYELLGLKSKSRAGVSLELPWIYYFVYIVFPSYVLKLQFVRVTGYHLGFKGLKE